ncbi:MAG: histidine kinase [Bacteroidia bacterium]|jgi:signal transduction histidine kinase/ligand-binding sensor domain-containing protein|nr:histidine kinase [Bacteroidia bacterium]
MPLLQAQNAYVIDNWQVQDGLPTNSIRAITQTHEGYLWIGTNGGLARFDGLKFTHYDIGRIAVLRSNRIVALMEDSRKRLWIGTYGGGLCYYQDGKFESFDLRKPGSAYCTPNILREIPGRGLFVGTGEMGLYVIAPNGSIQHFDQNAGLLSLAINDIFTTDDQTIYVSTAKELLKYESGKLIPSFIRSDSLKFSLLYRCVFDEAHQSITGLMIKSKGTPPRLFTLKKNNLQLAGDIGISRKLFGTNLAYYKPYGLLLQDAKGVFVLKRKQNETSFQSEVLVDGSKYGINHLTCFFIDREKNIWMGTEANGIYRLKNNPFGQIDYRLGTSLNSTVSIVGDTNELYWCIPKIGIACMKKGVVTILPKTENYWTLLKHGDTIYATGYGDGFLKIIKGKPEFISYGGIKDVWGKAMMRYQDKLWLGNYDNLLIRQNNQWISHPIQEVMRNKRINRFFKASTGTVYICADKGIYILNQNLRIDSVRFQKPMALYHVRCAYEVNPTTYLFGTYGNGLIIYQNGRTVVVNSQLGLIDNTISEIVNLNGYYWFTGNKGLSRVSANSLHAFIAGKQDLLNASIYDQSDGLTISEFNGGTQENKLRLYGNTYAFNCINGLTVVDFDKIGNNTHVPGVMIELVTAGDSLVSPFEHAIIPYANNRIAFEFTSLSLISAKNNRFKYLLKGYDKQWREAGTDRKAIYTNLAPGEYEFTVLGSNNDGVWSKTGATYTFTIKPPFYLALWFRTLVIVLLGILILGIILFIIRSIKKKEKAKQLLLQLTQNARLSAIYETEELERKRIAEDLHDGIGPLLSTVKINLSLAERSNEPSAMMQDAKNQLDQIATELRNITYNLVPASLNTFGLSIAVTDFVQKITDSLPIKLYAETIGEIKIPTLSQTILFRVIQEIVNNAIKHSGCNEITIQLIADDGLLRIMIEDDGKGFDQQTATKKLESRGLKNIFDRCTALGASIHLDTELGRGTVYTIEIPNSL